MAANARVLINSGKYAEAAEEINRCLQLDPHHSECNRLNISVLSHLGQPDRARRQLDEVMRNPPTERPRNLPRQPLNSFGGSQQQP